ncbi:MAG: class I SAM-dependent methyltransferase [Lysobacterales bacterium]|nr:MAG: class I SAM-dependent methyltransferase [Xanthomonadales bacterium]
MSDNFVAINSAKANFDDIYVKADPRAYFSVLGALDYMIPDVAAPVVRQIIAAFARRYGRKPRVLDVGASYGINAAVHRFPVTFSTLRRRYARHEMAALEPAEVARLDRNYYASWPDKGLATFVGLDVSEQAIRYAKDVGLIEEGIVADLEHEPLTARAAEIVADVDIVLSTGAVGYVSEKTFGSILEAATRPPWVVSFVLRMFPYDDFQALFEASGLSTEHLDSALFTQRRFTDLAEFEHCLQRLAGRGLDSGGLESRGLLQADLFVSRPASDVRHGRLEDIVTISVGRNRPTGPRYVHVPTLEGQQVALEP